MFKPLVFLTGFLGLITTVEAADELPKLGEFQTKHVESIIQGIDLVLLEASDYLERNPDKEQLVLHETLGQYVERTAGLRALIATDKTGMLKIDSFTYPAKNINLQDRAYVKASLDSEARTLHIAKPVVGRSSGASFIPFSRPLFDARKQPVGVIAGVMHPGFLIKQELLCAQCFIGVFNGDGDRMVTYPSDAQYPENFLKKTITTGATGLIEHNVSDLSVHSVIHRLKKYDVWVITSQFKTN